MLYRNVTAGADNAQAADATTGQATTAGASEGKVSFKLGDQDISVTPEELAEWKNSFEKKTTNADRLLQKKSQEYSAKIKATEAREKQLIALEETLRQSRQDAGRQVKDEFAEAGLDTSDPEVKKAIQTVQLIVEKQLQEKYGKKLSEVEKKLSDQDKNFENLTIQEKAKEVKLQAKTIIDSSALDGEDKQDFMHIFLGKYDVDRMQPEEIVETLTEEVQAYEAKLKRRGLLKNKEYVDKKTETNKKAKTDSSGVGGRSETESGLKGLKGREYRAKKESILMEIANGYLNRGK